jgi:hypothetical protein
MRIDQVREQDLIPLELGVFGGRKDVHYCGLSVSSCQERLARLFAMACEGNCTPPLRFLGAEPVFMRLLPAIKCTECASYFILTPPLFGRQTKARYGFRPSPQSPLTSRYVAELTDCWEEKLISVICG